MSKRARMGQLAQLLVSDSDRVEAPAEAKATPEEKTGEPKTDKPVFRKVAKRQIEQRPSPTTPIDIERPYGERGDFEKITVTLPPDVRALLLDESLKRKKSRDKNWPIAQIVREAISAHLGGKR